MATDTDVENFLAHHGIKGMRWGHRKSPTASEGGATAPTRKDLRGMNKVARAGLRADAKQKAVDNDNAIKAARANRKASQQAIKDARKQYKGDKKQIGSVAARQIMLQNTEKPMKDLLKAGELTRGEATVNAIGSIALSVLLK